MKKLLLFFFLLLLFIFPIPSLADGMVVSPPYFQVYETGQKAVIWFENGQEILILSTTFKGDAADFGWIIPVPTKPEVEKGNDEIFTALKELTEPEYRVQPMPLGRGFGALEAPMQEKVTVIETKKVDIYEVSVVTSTESEALAEWFAQNDYPYPVSQAYILDEYIKNDWYFVAAKIDTEKLGSSVQGQLQEGHATPLMIKFTTSKIVYPLKISSVTGEFYESDVVYQEGFNYSTGGWQAKEGVLLEQDQNEAYEGARSLKIVNQQPTKIEIYRGLNQLKKDREYAFSAYLKLSEEGDGSAYLNVSQNGLDKNSDSLILSDHWQRLTLTFVAQAASHRLKIIGQEFEKGESFNLDAVQVELGSGASPFELSSEKVLVEGPSSQEAYPLRKIFPPSYPPKEKIEILLYIFDPKKKVEIPGFKTEYAGWVGAREIKNLAVDDQGEPLLLTKKKMYLTKLVRSMGQSEMTHDLYPRYAQRNQAVGRGSSIAVEPLTVVLVFAVPFLLEVGFVSWLFLKRKEKE